MKTIFTILLFSMVTNFSLKAQVALHTEPTLDTRTFYESNGVTVTRMPFASSKSTVGSQFLFGDWVKGVIVNNAGSRFSDGLFNFDKVGQNLYMQIPDTLAVFHVDKH